MEERTFPNSFYKGSIIPKPKKASREKQKKKKTYWSKSFVNIHKNQDQTISKQKPVIKAYPGAILGSVPYNHNKASITRQNWGFPSAYKNIY